MNLEDLKTQEDLDAFIVNAIEDGKKGLEAKVNELLSEKKTEAAKRKEAEEATKAKELDLAKSAGKVEEVERALSEQYGGEIEQLKTQLIDRDNEILGSNKSTILESLAGKFVSPAAAKLMLSNMVETVRGESGIVNNFKGLDGSVVTTDVEKFTEYLSSQDSLKPLLKGADSSGGGASGSKGDSSSASGSGDTVKDRLQARLKDQGLIN